MSKFDKYGGGNPLLPSPNNSAGVSAKVASELTRAARLASTAGNADQILRGHVPRVAIALDATGSMAGLLKSAKNCIAQIISRVTKEAGSPIEIEMFVYRDYDVPQMLVARSGCHSDPQKLIAWLNSVEASGGGANDGEAIEAALDLIVRDGNFSLVLVAGDEPSNSAASLAAAGRRNSLTARLLAEKLGAMKVPLYSFVVGGDPRTVADFRTLASVSGGKSGRLDGSNEMIDLAVMAILATLKGLHEVRRYASSVSLSDNSRQFAQLLLSAK